MAAKKNPAPGERGVPKIVHPGGSNGFQNSQTQAGIQASFIARRFRIDPALAAALAELAFFVAVRP